MTQEAPLWLEPPGDIHPLWRSFDHAWYAGLHLGGPDAVDADEAQRHYHETGAALGLSPNRWFDEAWYRQRHPDVAAAIAAGRLRSGFEHYCRDGFRGRSAHWLFDPGLYLAPGGLDPVEVGYDDCVNLYGHFLRYGARQSRQGHLLFDPALYRAGVAQEPGALAAIEARGAWHHFIDRIWFERRDAVTTPWFDPDWYLARTPAAAQRLRRGLSVCALHDYLAFGIAAGAAPVPQFDEGFYLGANADAAEAVRAGRALCGYDHFLRVGARENRQPAAHIDLRRYHATSAAARIAMATGAARDAFTHLVLSGATAPEPGLPEDGLRLVTGGHVDSHGLAATAGGWAFLGWVPGDVLPGPAPGATEVVATARFTGGEWRGPATLVRFPRPDLPGGGAGALVFLPAPPQPAAMGGLAELELEAGGDIVRLPAQVTAAPLTEPVLITHATASIAALPATDPAIAHLRILLERRPYAGASTLAQLRDPVFFQVDETILCPPLPGHEPGARAGLALNGWMLAAPGTVTEVSLQCGGRSAPLVLDHVPRPERPDALQNVGTAHGLSELRSGFIAYAADIHAEGEVPHIAITTARGEVGYHPLPPPRLRGLPAIRTLLEKAELRHGEIPRAFDNALGPAVLRLNAARLAVPPDHRVVDFGTQPGQPRLSVIVTLFQRLDFLEYQLAFFTRHARAAPYELIYVLDDPARARQLETLAASAHARFGVPFRLVLLSENIGFGPANNLGLALARAPYVCFLNSDVFPGTPDWMEQLVARLRDTPELGAVGPLLLYEDGTVQHQGMRFERLAQYGDFHFPMHPGKGFRPTQPEGLRRADAITGACVVMARWLAQEMGGFDPAYPVGDFEDADLCLRLRARGLEVAVDMGVRLYHLERQSQAGSEKLWRMNLTLFNAWLHDSRWRDILDALPAPNDDLIAEAPA
jgi:GT2 family glycosyltransferase